MLKLNIWHKIFKTLLGLNLAFAGLGHLFWARKEFLAQVPQWLPLDADFVVLVSGFVEIALGASLLIIWRDPKKLGIVVALFFVMIFPGNISQYVNEVDAFGLNSDRARFIRLFFQPLLVLWALWSCGFFISHKKANSKELIDN